MISASNLPAHFRVLARLGAISCSASSWALEALKKCRCKTLPVSSPKRGVLFNLRPMKCIVQLGHRVVSIFAVLPMVLVLYPEQKLLRLVCAMCPSLLPVVFRATALTITHILFPSTSCHCVYEHRLPFFVFAATPENTLGRIAATDGSYTTGKSTTCCLR